MIWRGSTTTSTTSTRFVLDIFLLMSYFARTGVESNNIGRVQRHRLLCLESLGQFWVELWLQVMLTLFNISFVKGPVLPDLFSWSHSLQSEIWPGQRWLLLPEQNQNSKKFFTIFCQTGCEKRICSWGRTLQVKEDSSHLFVVISPNFYSLHFAKGRIPFDKLFSSIGKGITHIVKFLKQNCKSQQQTWVGEWVNEKERQWQDLGWLLVQWWWRPKLSWTISNWNCSW